MILIILLLNSFQEKAKMYNHFLSLKKRKFFYIYIYISTRQFYMYNLYLFIYLFILLLLFHIFFHDIDISYPIHICMYIHKDCQKIYTHLFICYPDRKVKQDYLYSRMLKP